MAMTRYMISDAARQVDVEAHVLRYWEEELGMDIQRNEMGHRYYTEEDIVRLREIHEMKEKGYGLKAIRMVLQQEADTEQCIIRKTNMEQAVIEQTNTDQVVDRAEQHSHTRSAKELFTGLMQEILRENNQELVRAMNEEVGDRVIKQLDYLFREQEEREEERFQKFDEVLRMKQKKKRRLCRK